MTVILLFLMLFVTACTTSKKAEPEKVDNAATRYADGLRQSETRAQDAAAVANKRIEQFNKTNQQVE